MTKVQLKPRKAQPFFARHPWVLESAIRDVAISSNKDDEVDLVTDQGQWIARGLINSESRTRVRLYTWDASQPLDDAFWFRRLDEAISLRRRMGYLQPEGAERLVYSEADRLSGLIVDRFAQHVVIQVNSRGMERRLPQICSALGELLAPDSITVRVDDHARNRERVSIPSGLIFGQQPPEICFIEEHGLRYGVELLTGQKSGFYLDQSQNRKHAAPMFRERSVLDMCCYTGAFSLAAVALGGAREVLGIDTSEHSVQFARANAERNGISQARFETGDMFRSLEELKRDQRRFDAIILDPPKFAHGRSRQQQALKAYHQLNRLAIEILQPDGILVTCSCSGSVSSADFEHMLFGVSTRSRRDVQILARYGASTDHPTLVTCPETSYLKCFVCRVY